MAVVYSTGGLTQRERPPELTQMSDRPGPDARAERDGQ